MIYLIQSIGQEVEEFTKHTRYFPIAKIGYTKDKRTWETRLATYQYHNKIINVIKVIDIDSESLEKALHKKFEKYLFEGNEWFYFDNEILNYFIESSEDDFIALDLAYRKESEIFKRGFRRKFNKASLEERYEIIEEAKSYSIDLDKYFPELLLKLFNKYTKEGLLEIVNGSKELLLEEKADSFIYKYHDITVASDKIKFMCDSYLEDEDATNIFLNQLPKNDMAKSLFLTVGCDKCRSFGFSMSI